MGIPTQGQSGTTLQRRAFSQSRSSLQTPRVSTIFTRNDRWRISHRLITTSDHEKNRFETIMTAADSAERFSAA